MTATTEPGKTGKPAERTVKKEGHEARTESLTAASVASLIKSEFAGTPGRSEGEEVQPKAGEETPKNNGAGTESPEHEATAEETTAGAEEQHAEHEPAEETPAAEQGEVEEGGTPGAEVPEALQAAIQEWEEAGRGELPPALQGLVDGRINKLTARAKTAEGRIAELEAELEAASAAATHASGAQGTGAGEFPDIKAVNDAVAKSKAFVKEVRAYFEDAATEEEKGRVERYMESERLDARGLKRRMLDVGDWLTQEAPALQVQAQQGEKRKQSFAQEEKVATAKAEEHFPWLKDKESPQYRDAQEVLKSVPDLVKRTPLHKLVMGVYVLGLQQARKLYPETFGVPGGKATNGTNGNGVKAGVKPGKAPPKAPVAGAAAPKPRATKSAEEESARTEFNKRPTAEGVAQLVKIGLRG